MEPVLKVLFISNFKWSFIVLRNKRTIINKAISIGISILVFFIVLEICARIDDNIKYNAPLLSKYTNNRLRSTDEDGLRYNIPNAQFEKWQNNRFGFRGPNFDDVKPKELTRVVCMGASETYGLYEDHGKEWPAQLSQILKPLNSYQIINTSTVGLKRKHLLKYLDKYVYKFDPDIIIFLISPSFIDRQNKSNLNKKNIPIKNTNVNKFALSDVISNIRIIPKTWQMIKSFVPKSLLEKYQYWDRSNKINDTEKRFLHGKNPLDSIPVKNQNNYKAEIDNIVTTVQSKGIKVILCTYPYLLTKDNIDTYPLVFMENRRFTVELSYIGMIDASKSANVIIKNIADERYTGFVDCYSAIPKNLTYFGDNVHLTNKGSEIISRLLADYLIKNEQN